MKTSLKLAALLVGLSIIRHPPSTALAQASNIGEGDQYAWSANAGWINFIPHRPNTGDGVRVSDSYLSGYAWSANVGWINFGDGTPANSVRYANTNSADFGVNHDGGGNLSGLAWSANTGWINFGLASSTNINRPRFDAVNGAFSGYAWSANLGWINLATGILKVDNLIIADSDGDGISDSWELGHTNSLPVLTASGDVDGDGITDKQEYILDTNPLVPNSPFAITRITSIPNLSYVEIEWPSSPARIYGLEYRTNLVADNWVFALNVPGAANTNATTVPVTGTLPQVFMRLEAKLPLQP
jgi:hypothetical protein